MRSQTVITAFTGVLATVNGLPVEDATSSETGAAIPKANSNIENANIKRGWLPLPGLGANAPGNGPPLMENHDRPSALDVLGLGGKKRRDVNEQHSDVVAEAVSAVSDAAPSPSESHETKNSTALSPEELMFFNKLDEQHVPTRGACAYMKSDFKSFNDVSMRIPNGVEYNEKGRHCGSGFLDNIRAHAPTRWECHVDPNGRDITLHFKTHIFVYGWALTKSIMDATRNEVRLDCKEVTSKGPWEFSETAVKKRMEGEWRKFMETDDWKQHYDYRPYVPAWGPHHPDNNGGGRSSRKSRRGLIDDIKADIHNNPKNWNAHPVTTPPEDESSDAVDKILEMYGAKREREGVMIPLKKPTEKKGTDKKPLDPNHPWPNLAPKNTPTTTPPKDESDDTFEKILEMYPGARKVTDKEPLDPNHPATTRSGLRDPRTRRRRSLFDDIKDCATPGIEHHANCVSQRYPDNINGACAYMSDSVMKNWLVRVQDGASYNDPNRHCGSGFLDNLRQHLPTGWECTTNSEGKDTTLAFNTHTFTTDEDIRQSFLAATGGKVDLAGCRRAHTTERFPSRELALKANVDSQWLSSGHFSSDLAKRDVSHVQDTQRKRIGACAMYDGAFAKVFSVRVPNGQAYNDPERHCGSGFLDNIRGYAPTGWTCVNEPFDAKRQESDTTLRFNLHAYATSAKVQGAVSLATGGKVQLADCVQVGSEWELEDEMEKQWKKYVSNSARDTTALTSLHVDPHGLDATGKPVMADLEKPKYAGSCTYHMNGAGSYIWDIRIPNGAAYNDPERHCGSGFLDNMREKVLPTEWKCEQHPFDSSREMTDVSLKFHTDHFLDAEKVQLAILMATGGDVFLPCESVHVAPSVHKYTLTNEEEKLRKDKLDELAAKQWKEYLASLE